MPMSQLVSDALAVPNGHFAQATTAPATGQLVFVSGMTARNAEGGITGVGDVTAQTHQVCQNVKAAVEAAGGTLADIARVDVYVRDMAHFDAIHEVRKQYWDVAPASTMVEVSGFVKEEYLIEMNAIAVVEGSGGDA